MSRKTTTALGFILLAVLFVSLNVLANNMLRAWRIDLTAEKLFTLSQGSKKVVAAIQEPITLRFFYSESLAQNLPAFRAYGQRVREMIEEYVALSDGKVRLEVVEPKTYTEAEDEARRLGLRAAPLNDGSKIYFGLVGTNTTDDQEVIPFFQQNKESFLEYELTRLIYALSDPKKPTIGLLTGFKMNVSVSPMAALNPRAPKPWAIVETIRSAFNLLALRPDLTEIPKQVDVLFIVHPQKLSDAARYAIDQYVLAGGKTLILLDPMSELMAGSLREGRAREDLTASNLPELLKAWGLRMPKNKVIGDWASAQMVNVGAGGAQDVVRYLPWLRLDGRFYNQSDIITSSLGELMLATAGSFEIIKGATTKVTALVMTSAQSQLIDTDKVKFGPDPRGLMKNFKPDAKQHLLAVRVQGKAASAFPKGRPKPAKKAAKNATKDNAAKDTAKKAGKTPAKTHLATAKNGINVVLLADADMIYDQFWARAQTVMGRRIFTSTTSNGSFVINTLENLTGSSDLINLRSRGRSTRPFLVVEKIRRAAEQKYLAQEQQLTEKLEATVKKITELQSKAKVEGGNLLSSQQRAAIAEARALVRQTRKELRAVKFNLTRDIEDLESQLIFANVALVPMVFTFLALIMASFRRRRRRRAQMNRHD